MSLTNVVIYGAGSIGKLAAQIINDINSVNQQFRIIGFLDDNLQKIGNNIFGYKVIGSFDWFNSNKYQECGVIIGFSDPNLRFILHTKLKQIKGVSFPSLIHPRAWISENVYYSIGTIIYPDVLIDVEVNIGDFVQINKSSTIGHDTVINNYVTISPGVNLGGFNNVGEGCMIGINSCTIQKINLGNWGIIGAGSVVVKDTTARSTYVGNPSKKIK